ncbi:MAG: amino acid permease [Chlamydiae bacterium]|nr:amino acid permease [Chlamydiota bacterium]
MVGKEKQQLSRVVAQLERTPLKRVLGIRDLFAIGYGDLSSSIYYALGVTALYALGATPLSLALAGIVFICTALTYAEMSSTFHESGGSASFARHAFNDLISFIAGWGLLLDYIVTIAISAFAVAPYLSFIHPFLNDTPVQIGFTVCLISILFFMNLFGVKQSTKISELLAGATLLTQIAIIIIGIFFILDLKTIFSHMRIGVPNVDWSPSWPEFFKGTAMAMVAYTGIESIAQLGSEAKDPSRNLPKACIRVMWVLVAIYFGISVVALSALTPKLLGTTYLEDPIAGIVQHLPFGKHFLPFWVGIVAAMLLFVAANAGIMGASRLAFNMGRYYQLPRFFSQVHTTYQTPHISLAVFAVLAALIVIWSRGKLSFLADLYNFGAMVAFFSAHASLIVLRVKQPDLERPFRVPFNIRFRSIQIPISALIGAAATFSVWCLVVITKPQGRYLGLVWMAAGTAMYLLYRRKKRIAPAGQIAIERIKIPELETLKIHQILVPIKSGLNVEKMQFAAEIAKLHHAKITAIHIIEVPYSIPIDAPVPYRTTIGETILQRMEAIARELNVEIEVKIIRARSVAESILQVIEEKKYDLLILGEGKVHKEHYPKTLDPITDRLFRLAPCRVWLFSPMRKG